MCSKDLIDVHVNDIRNVLASEQELMLDLRLHAINPNIVTVQVNDLDINIFAKSKYVGTSSLWRDTHPKSKNNQSEIRHPSENDDSMHTMDDDYSDPFEDPETDSQTMLLGRIFQFDSPLVFDASPIQKHHSSSTGEVRLAKPGNRTEEGGSARWEKVSQHKFILIVRGVIKYSLPINSKTRSATISGHVLVYPGDDEDNTETLPRLGKQFFTAAQRAKLAD